MKPLYSLAIAILVSLSTLISCGGSSGSGTTTSENRVDQTEQAPSNSDTGDASDGMTSFEYAYGTDPQQFGILRIPEDTPGPYPVVVIIHGGCWLSTFGSDFTAPLSQALTRMGKATWNIEYRRLGSGGEWPAIFVDTMNAIDFIPSIATQHNLNTQNVVGVGHSAGGHLALWAAGRGSIRASSELFRENFLPLSGVLGLGAVSDLDSDTCNRGLTTLIDGTQLSESALTVRLSTTSPIDMLPIGTNTVLFSGGSDELVPAFWSAAYTQTANNLGDNSEHYVLEGLDHFDLIDPEMLDPLFLLDVLERLGGAF